MHSPYLLLPVVVFTLILYFSSALLVKTGILDKTVHRKIWNTLLLVTFIVTAILGLLLTIQINYKLQWTFVKKLLKWHVNVGIGMSIITVFHLIWHWSYYLSLFNNSPERKINENAPGVDTKLSHLTLMIFLSGMLATVVQVLFIREITTVFEGNELMMCWTLGTWMLLTGTGALLGRRRRAKHKGKFHLTGIIMLLAIIPIIIMPLIILLKRIFFPPGVLVAPSYFLLILLLILSPVCLLSGWIFAWLVHNYRNTENNFMKVYAFEALGSLIGGLCVSFILIRWFSVLESLLLLGLIVAGIVYLVHKKALYLFQVILTAMFLACCFIFPVENYLKAKLFINQKVITSVETYYGNMAVTENAGQYNFYSNGSLLFTSDNTVLSEEYVHYALLQLTDPKDVLLVSGGAAGMAREILKYPDIRSITYIEQNPEIFHLAARFDLLPPDQRINETEGDIRRFISHDDKKYDAVIMALPDPTSLQVNRLYTVDCVKLLKLRVKPGGVIIYGMNPVVNYISDIQKQLEASLYNTLNLVFNQVMIIPGERDYFVASDSALSPAISQLCGKYSFENLYVNAYYIDDRSIAERSNYILSNISDQKEVNTDNRPFPVFLNSLHFLLQFGHNWKIWLSIPLILLLLPVFRMRSLTAGIYITGFTGASIEILIIFILQTVFGYVYAAIGMIIAVFMCGLAMGAYLGSKAALRLRYLVSAQASLMIFCFFFLLVWYFLSDSGSNFILLVSFFILTLIPSILTGFIFVLATKLTTGDIHVSAPVNYAVDLFGSSLGVLVFSILILPLAGITGGCILLGAINLLAVLLNVPYRLIVTK